MLLLIALTLKGSVSISPTPPIQPPPTNDIVADGYGRYDQEREQRKRKDLMYEDEMILAFIEAFVKTL